MVLTLIVYIVWCILLIFIMINCLEVLSLRRTNSCFRSSPRILRSVVGNICLRCTSWSSSKLLNILCKYLLLLIRYWRIYLLSVKILYVFLIILYLIFSELLYLIYCSSIDNLPWYWRFILICFLFGINKVLIIWRIYHLNISHFCSFIISLTVLVISLLIFIWDETH